MEWSREWLNDFNPLFYRYISTDSELKEFVDKTTFSTRQRSVALVANRLATGYAIPRAEHLASQLGESSQKYGRVIVPRRIDGRHHGEISIGDVFEETRKKLEERIEMIRRFVVLGGRRRSPTGYNDYFSDIAYATISGLGVEANLANDIRHGFRSEIEEFGDAAFGSETIGSSTMPHKINPAMWERVVGLWKVYSPRMVSFLMAQVVEHQGDSTNDYLSLQVPELLLAFSYGTKYTSDSFDNLKVKSTNI